MSSWTITGQDGPAFFTVFGHFSLFVEGRPLPLGGPKAAALLAGLLARRGGRASIDQLVEDLWGDGAPVRARTRSRPSCRVCESCSRPSSRRPSS